MVATLIVFRLMSLTRICGSCLLCHRENLECVCFHLLGHFPVCAVLFFFLVSVFLLFSFSFPFSVSVSVWLSVCLSIAVSFLLSFFFCLSVYIFLPSFLPFFLHLSLSLLASLPLSYWTPSFFSFSRIGALDPRGSLTVRFLCSVNIAKRENGSEQLWGSKFAQDAEATAAGRSPACTALPSAWLLKVPFIPRCET